MTDYERLVHIVDEIPALISANISSSDSRFQAWKTKAERFLIRKYGKDSYEYTRFDKTYFSLGVFTFSTPEADFIKACQSGLRETEAIFKYPAVVQSLTGALTVAERKQNAGAGEKSRNGKSGDHGNGETDHALEQISRHRRNACIEYL